MLVLGRRDGEGIKLDLGDGGEVYIRVRREGRSRMSFVITAPDEVRVSRIDAAERVESSTACLGGD